MSNKRGYYVCERDADVGFAIIATTTKEAKNIAWKTCDLWCDWIDVIVSLKRDAIVDDLPIGFVQDDVLALRRGLYSWIEDITCEVCHNQRTVELYNNKVVCRNCIDEGMESQSRR